MHGKLLKLRNKIDLFSKQSIENELMEFTFNYFYTGSRVGYKPDGNIELFVTTYLVDANDNLFIRYAIYSGHKRYWKETIENQLRTMMKNIDVSEQFIKSSLRFHEVTQDKFQTTEKFETSFLDLKAKINK